jgi:hypothetical protein
LTCDGWFAASFTRSDIVGSRPISLRSSISTGEMKQRDLEAGGLRPTEAAFAARYLAFVAVLTLKEGGRSSSGGIRARRWSVVFLTAEFAITLFMITGVVMGLRQFLATQRADLVIDTSRLLTAWVSLPPQKYRTSEERMAFVDAVDARLGAHGSIAAAGVASALPAGGGVARQLAIAGREPEGRETLPTVWSLAVGASYFGTTGVRLRHAVLQLGIGLTAGVALTFMLEALFADRQATFRQTDVSVLVAASFVIAFVALAACMVPAHRAARLDPVVALRHE